MADDTAENQPKGLPAHLRDDLKFKPGQSGNPAGRPKGARSKLSEAFFEALSADFAEHGVSAIIKMRDNRPQDYVRAIASLQTKEMSGPGGEPISISEIRRVIVDPED